jgi:hypothetical protein
MKPNKQTTDGQCHEQDFAPDVYETPDLTDGGSTVPVNILPAPAVYIYIYIFFGVMIYSDSW